jgi:ferredoxin
MGKAVVIDTDECIGCESCVELCSEVFAFNEEEEKAEVIMPEGGPDLAQLPFFTPKQRFQV